ncbi:MAG: hypothetical protein KVP17_001762 [Porospora cf. gigantea B]|uniref:uncharacterized protein n=1 Tax=Porospora cf. gigantea B TaxID=2853592 RepID=UPI003571DF18|nr:MAG: hypothetical protein KVP17_001762 [Porospora cf. gigantea B]
MRVHERFFVLRPLLDIAEDFVDPKRVKTIRELYADLEEKAQTDELLKVFHLDQPVVRVFPLGSGSKLQLVQSFEPTVFVGILNVTSDSFSDGGSLLDDNGILDPVSLIGKATDLIRGGASILDVGAESTRPKADPVDSRTQLRRVVPALTLLRAVFPKVLLSLDSRDPVTVEFCYNEGLVDLVNDTSGLDHDSGLPELVSHFTGISVIVIHARGVPKTMDSKILRSRPDSMTQTDVARELNIVLSRWLAAGVPRWRLIADFGFGFAKTVSQNRDIIASLDQVAASLPTGVPCMLGYSRKRFTRADLPKDAWTAADEAGKELFVQLKSRGIDQRALAFNRVHSMSLYEEFVVSNHCA